MGQLRDCSETKKRQIPSIEVQNSLKDEVKSRFVYLNIPKEHKGIC